MKRKFLTGALVTTLLLSQFSLALSQTPPPTQQAAPAATTQYFYGSIPSGENNRRESATITYVTGGTTSLHLALFTAYNATWAAGYFVWEAYGTHDVTTTHYPASQARNRCFYQYSVQVNSAGITCKVRTS